MSSDLQSLRNVGPKMAGYLLLAGIVDTAAFRALGAIEATKRIFLAGELTPHQMYFYAPVAAEQDRDISSFDLAEKRELKIQYAELMMDLS